MKSGGFDVVIGNPPYGAQLSSSEINHLREKYSTAEYQVDTYPLFIEKAYILNRAGGYLGMIVPSAWVASKYNETLRMFVASNTTLHTIVITPKNTFASASVETLILVTTKGKSKSTNFKVERWDQIDQTSYFLSQDEIANKKPHFFPIYSNPIENQLVTKIMRHGLPLSNYASAVWGVKIYQKGKGNPKQNGTESEAKMFHSLSKTKSTHKPLLGGKDIARYKVEWSGVYVDYGQWLAEPRNPEWFNGDRILVREVTDRGIIQATIVKDEYVFSNSVDGIKLRNNAYELAFVLGIINSKLLSFYHLNTSANAFKGAFPKLLIKDLMSFPIAKIDFSDPKGKARHDRMVELVDRMLSLHKQLSAAKTSHDKTTIQRQIDATDEQIDQLVYELYGLTEEEIKIVEGETNKT
jgi:hypothetical protein